MQAHDSSFSLSVLLDSPPLGKRLPGRLSYTDCVNKGARLLHWVAAGFYCGTSAPLAKWTDYDDLEQGTYGWTKTETMPHVPKDFSAIKQAMVWLKVPRTGPPNVVVRWDNRIQSARGYTSDPDDPDTNPKTGVVPTDLGPDPDKHYVVSSINHRVDLAVCARLVLMLYLASRQAAPTNRSTMSTTA